MDTSATTSEHAPATETVFGHPRGLLYLTFTEIWERFSFYGMSGLVMLYMVNQLLLPEHAEHVFGLARFRAAIESLVGPLSTQAFASQIFGLYAGFVYFTPLFGGMIADRWIGQRPAVTIGALLMSGGHLAMAFDQSFLVALLLLVIGSGFLKGNISAQVGALYPHADEARRCRGYVIYSTGINIGAVLGPLLCGLLAQVFGWHYGFGAAAIVMLVGLVTYLSGYRHLPVRVRRSGHEGERLSHNDWRIVGVLVAVIIITVFQSIAYYQLFNVGPVWIQQYVASDIGGFHVPVPWYQAIHSLFSVAAVAPLLWLWRHQASRGREPDDIRKIGVGAGLAALANLVLVVAIYLSQGGLIHPAWPLLYCFVLGVAFLYYWPTLLALVSRAAPAKVNSTMMGIAFMSMFVSNNLIGWIAGFYERIGPTRFWALHAVIAAMGSVLVLMFGRRLSRGLQTRV